MKRRAAEQLDKFDCEDTERLETLCKALRLFGLQATPRLVHGIPFRETLKVAEELGVGLIVLGSQGRSAIREALIGSTLENVARLCRQPVLVVRQDSGPGR